MKILIDKNIPYVEHFFADHLDQIEYFSDEDFEIENVKEDSVVVVRSTYKTHGKKIPESIKLLCSASTGQDHIDLSQQYDDDYNVILPCRFSTGANAIAVREYVFSALALMLKERKFNKSQDSAAIIGLGNIGKELYKVLDFFGFSVFGSDPILDFYYWLDLSLDEMGKLNYTEEDLRELHEESNFFKRIPGTDHYHGGITYREYGDWSDDAILIENDLFTKNNIKLISLHVPLVKGSQLDTAAFSTHHLIGKSCLENLTNEAIIINTSRGGVLDESVFLELDHKLNLISDVFENEPNINKDFLDKNLFATPHIAGHSQYARYQMTKMAYENVANFLGIKNTEKENILENKIVDFDKNTFDQDMKEFGLPVSLMLDTYNPKLDHFECADFKKTRDNYNNRIGYSQIVIKGCEDDSDRIALKMLGFKVQDS